MVQLRPARVQGVRLQNRDTLSSLPEGLQLKGLAPDVLRISGRLGSLWVLSSIFPSFEVQVEFGVTLMG